MRSPCWLRARRTMAETVVIKVGGSLFDLPDLSARLRNYLRQWEPLQILLVPGGGGTANVIRTFDQLHHLGEERAHWLALRALAVNAHFLAELLPRSRVIQSLEEMAAL